MQILELNGVTLEGVYSCLPAEGEDNLSRCTRLYGDVAKAESVVKATGIRRRRLAALGTTSLDLCIAAASALMLDAGVGPEQIGGVVFVTFTPAMSMPCNACQVQRRLGLGSDIVAFDVGLACSGYAYGLYLAGTLAKATQKKILLLDGDVQSAAIRPDDEATVPVLADAGTCSLVSPDCLQRARCPLPQGWKFAFMSKGEGGEALRLPVGGTISMDGFAVYRFVAADVTAFLKEFIANTGAGPDAVEAFVPHQANVYMIRQLSKALKFPPEKLLISGDEVGNSASATVPVTISRCVHPSTPDSQPIRLLISGFGGGLSASAGSVTLAPAALLRCFDFVRE